MNNIKNCPLAEGFTIREKFFAQTSFLAMGFIGTIGIIMEDWIWIFPYIFIYWYGIPGIVMRHLNCPRCPHLHEFGDCLQAPVFLTKLVMKKRKTNPYSIVEKFLFYLIFIAIPIYPIYWLLANKILLTLFLISASMWYLGQVLYFCKRCRLYDCPFNRVTLTYN